MDNDDLTEMSLDDSEDDTEEEKENVNPKDLFSQEIFPNIFTYFDFNCDNPLLIKSKDLYSCIYSKNLSPPPELTV